MTGNDSSEAEKVFTEYVERVSGGERIDFRAFCRDRPDLAADLRELRERWIQTIARTDGANLSITDRIRQARGDRMESRIPFGSSKEGAEGDAAESPQTAKRIGRYSLKGEVARGGQGVILRVHDRDLSRDLAMKVVLGKEDKGGSSTSVADVAPQTLGRFLDEAQVTGRLDHPGIVPVHELGIDNSGRVFFTMKLVKGEDLIAVYEKVLAGKEDWTRTKALNVLVKVCEAMSYAHHKRVIHRDLKPGNVMVGRFGEVYVMDWGLARVNYDESAKRNVLKESSIDWNVGVGDSDDPDALRTMAGDVVGTPAYMPPEQAAGDIDALGPQSDVYAVGAMLYELLAGHPPYHWTASKLSAIEIWTLVREGPPTPIAKEAPDASLELVAICEKAMQRQPINRYPDMSGLAKDLSAYLEGRVVSAYERGAVAELKKWVTRNKPLALAMAAGVLALAVGLAASLVEKRRADANAELALEREQIAIAAEGKANDEKNRANDEAERANDEAERANRSATTAEQVSDFLVGLFRVVDPGEARGNTVTAREILDQGARRIQGELGAQPEIQSRLMDTMGDVYRSLGLLDQAVPLLEQTLQRRIDIHGPNHPRVADSLNDLGVVVRDRADYDRAELLLRRALDMRESHHGDRHVATAESLYDLAQTLAYQGKFAEAEPLFRQSLDVRRELLGEHPDVAESLDGLAYALYDQGNKTEPELLLREALEMRRETQPGHPDFVEALNNLGTILYELGNKSEAEQILIEALKGKRELFGDMHPEVALGLNNLSNLVHDRGELDIAESYYREALAIQREVRSTSHPDIAQALNNLAILLYDKKDFPAAKETFFDGLRVFRDIYEEGHPDLEFAYRDALEFMREYVEKLEEDLGPDHPDYAIESNDMAGLLLAMGNQSEALERSGQAYEVLAEAYSEQDWRTARAASVLGAVIAAQQGYDEAEVLLLESYRILEGEFGDASPETQETVERLVKLYEAWGRASDANKYRARVISRDER